MAGTARSLSLYKREQKKVKAKYFSAHGNEATLLIADPNQDGAESIANTFGAMVGAMM